MVADVEAVRPALDFDQIVLLGHSYGGVLAQAYALKYQEHLGHLVFSLDVSFDENDERGSGPRASSDAG